MCFYQREHDHKKRITGTRTRRGRKPSQMKIGLDFDLQNFMRELGDGAAGTGTCSQGTKI